MPPPAYKFHPEKLERLFLVPGTTTTILIRCELDSDGNDTVMISASYNTAGRVTTGRLISGGDEKLYVTARAAAVTGTPAGDRCAVLTLWQYVEAWYHEYVGPHVLKALEAFANSPPPAIGGGPC